METGYLKQDVWDDNICCPVPIPAEDSEYTLTQMDVDSRDGMCLPPVLLLQGEVQQTTVDLKQTNDFLMKEEEEIGVITPNLRETDNPDIADVERKETVLQECAVDEFDSQCERTAACNGENGVLVGFVSDAEPVDVTAVSLQDCSAAVTNVAAAAAGDNLEKDMDLDYFVHIDAENNHLGEDLISNSSLTLAANRSLDMSRSLTDRCFRMADLALSSDNLTFEKLPQRRIRKSLSSDLLKDANCEAFKVKGTSLQSPTVIPSSLSERSTLLPTSLVTEQSDNSKSGQRYCVVQEVVETERKYCTCLWLLLNHFAESLSQCELLEENDISVIFPPCLRLIYNYHSDFFNRLEGCLLSWTEFSTIADLFNQFVESVDCDLLMQYQTYVGVFPKAILHIRKLCRCHTEIETVIKDLEGDTCCEGLDIGAYLLTPIQRIPRYVLLLKQLSKCTNDSHPDFLLLESCLSKLGEFLSKLNESIETSMQFVSAESLPKQKRRFNLNNLSMRASTICDGKDFNASNFRCHANPSPPKANRISLDLSFLGLHKQKKQQQSDEKVVHSESCLHKAATIHSFPCSDRNLTSTPRLDTQNTNRGLHLPFRMQHFKRKLEEPHYNEDANKDFPPPSNIPSKPKTDKTKQVTNTKGLSHRLQTGKKSLFTKFRRTGVSNFSNALADSKVSAVCDTNERLSNEQCNVILSSENIIPATDLERPLHIPSPDVTIASDVFTLGISNCSTAMMSVTRVAVVESSAEMNVSNVSRLSGKSSLHQDVSLSSQNASVESSSSFLSGVFPPSKKSKLGNLTETSNTEPKKKGDIKRKMSVKDTLKNFFSRRGAIKTKTFIQHDPKIDSSRWSD